MSQIIEAHKSKTLELLKVKPLSPSEVAKHLGISREHTSREVIYPLRDDNKIVKVEGTNQYQLKSQNATSRTIQLEILSQNELNQTVTMARWLDHVSKHKEERHYYTGFSRILLGKTIKGYKKNPDTWVNPKDTDEVVSLLRKKYGVINLGSFQRSCVRRFLKFGLQIAVSKEEAKKLGITGAQDSTGNHARVSFEHGEYQKAKEFFKVNKKIVELLRFVVSFWTFCRPSSLFLIKCEKLQFYNREVEFIMEDGEKKIISVNIDGKKVIADKSTYRLAKKSGEPISISQDRVCFFEVFEQKTHKPFPKYMYDDEMVRLLEDFVAKRTASGHKYLFWESNDEFKFENYNTVVKTEREKWGLVLKELYTFLQIKDSYCFSDATYAMRHIGVQHWLQMTDYDYGFIAEMGWDNITTLRKWYGARSKSSFDQKMAQYGV